MKHRWIWMAAVFLGMSGEILQAETCWICEKPIYGDTIYVCTDEVARVKRDVCPICAKRLETCYLCSLPVLRDYTELPDGRFYCARDAKTVVFEEHEILRICEETRETMDRLFSRFITFPKANVSISAADRVSLLDLYKSRDFECPNVLGFTGSKTNNGALSHEISLMTGLTPSTVKSTFAHECTHAWVNENVSQERRNNTAADAREGFCELVSYLVVVAQGDEEAKKNILLNTYTRGHIDLFIEAEKRFGFNEIVDWMKYGVDDLLHEDDLARMRDLEVPGASRPPAGQAATNVVAAVVPAKKVEPPPPAVPASLTLNGITWSKTRPLALINNRSFGPQELGKVQLGTNSLNIRCLAVREDSVLIQKMDTGEKVELKLKAPSKK